MPTTPKQYRALGGQPVLRRAAAPFLAHPDIGGVRVVIHADDAPCYRAAVGHLPLMEPVPGGATRQELGAAGLESLAEAAPRHGADPRCGAPVRLQRRCLDRVLGALDAQRWRHSGAAGGRHAEARRRLPPAEPRINGTQERAGLWRAQTPQGFRYPRLLAAHRQAPA